MTNTDRKKYRVQRVLCKRCGDMVEYGEGTGVSFYELCRGEEMKDHYITCQCGYVWLYPFANELNRIIVDYEPFAVNHSEDVEDLSEEWKE